jgi:hypothetical protein
MVELMKVIEGLYLYLVGHLGLVALFIVVSVLVVYGLEKLSEHFE